MSNGNIPARVLAVLVLIVLLAGCATPTTTVPQPTADQNTLGTIAAQTAVVKSTLRAALNPSATPGGAGSAGEPQPTETGQPSGSDAEAGQATPTVEATATPTASEGETPAPGATATINPALYPTRTPRRIPDAAVFISSTPPDGAVFHPGNKFDAVWTLKNTGTTTWTTDYHIRFARGADMSEAPRFYLKEGVKPGETVDLVADMVAPDEKGIQVGYWEFVNGNSDIIFRMYVAITVE